MRLSSGAWSILVFAISSALPACSDTPAGPPTADDSPRVTGTYLAVGPGDLRGISFEADTSFVASWAPGKRCPSLDEPCTSRGKYAVDGALSTLSLHEDGTAETVSLPFEAASESPAPSEALAPQAKGGLMSDGPTELLKESAPLLARKINGQSVNLQNIPADVRHNIAHCFSFDWSKFRFKERIDETYDVNYAAGIASAVATNTAGGLFELYGRLTLRDSQGAKTLAAIESDLKTLLEARSLEDFQRAGLVTCISSSLIKYADNVGSMFGGTAASVNNHEGVCREFAAIAGRLFGVVNVHGGTKAGGVMFGGKFGMHAWSWVYLPSRTTTYWMEPQSDPTRDSAPFFRNRAPVRVGPVTIEP